MENAKITFLGAAQTVTGSATLIEYKNFKVLIDCGLFQGPKEIRKRNWQLFDSQLAESIDCVVLTHAHVDHSGMLPKLYQLGFRGPIYSSESTFDLAQILLPDSAYLQEEDAKRYTGRNGHDYYGPLFSLEDAEGSLKLFEVVGRHQWFEITPGLSFRFLRAGHILGSSIVQFSMSSENGIKMITFSGDLGNDKQRVIKGPEQVKETDDLILESTYGDRTHSPVSPEKTLKKLIHKIALSQGALVIPAFAVGRTQEILFIIKKLEEDGEVPKIPVYLDSPMALEATELYLKNSDDLKLTIKEGELIPPLSPSNFHRVKKMEDSMNLTHKKGPLIIISAAGMLTGGRILYHLKERLKDPNSIVVFVGYQAEETKGRLLQQGLKTIRIHKENITIRARIENIQSLSAHADSDELVAWVAAMKKKPKRVFLNHGEKSSQNALAYRLKHELGLEVIIPEPGQEFGFN